MKKNTEINERISHFIEYQFNGNKKKFAESIGFSPQVVANIVSGRKSKPSFDVINAISSTFVYLNPEWLLTGKGEMLRDERATKTNLPTGIPLIPIEAIAGNGGGAISIREGDIQDRYIIPDFQDVDFMIRVKGSSMYPKYNSGDIIACKMIKEWTFFQWGRVYVIHHKEQGTMIKRLFPVSQNQDKQVECRSDNERYPPFQVNLSEITNIALVIGVVRLE